MPPATRSASWRATSVSSSIKSRPRSAGNTALSRPPDETVSAEGDAPEPTYFLDRCLGSEIVPELLRSRGFDVRVHDDLFAPNCPDTEWLGAVAARGWVVLTKDRRILRRQAELDELRRTRAAAVLSAKGDMTGEQVAEAFARALPRLRAKLRTHDAPLIVRVFSDGSIQLIEGERRGGRRKPQS